MIDAVAGAVLAWGGAVLPGTQKSVVDDPWGTFETHIAVQPDGTRAKVEVRRGRAADIGDWALCDHAWQHLTFMSRDEWPKGSELVIVYLVPDGSPEGGYQVPQWANIDATWSRVWRFSRVAATVGVENPPSSVPVSDTVLPLISVITVVYNGYPEVEQTIQSILAQDYAALEFVVIDGGSEDQTTEVLDRYHSQIDVLISEEDQGVFDAMNKGWDKSTGSHMLFMNSGDMFIDRAAISRAITLAEGCEGSFAGSAVMVHPTMPGAVESSVPQGLVPHQALFMSRKEFGDLRFDPGYSLVGDSELWARFREGGGSFRHVDALVAIRRLGGISVDPKYLRQRYAEHRRRGRPQRMPRLCVFAIGLLGPALPQRLIDAVWFRWQRKLAP